MKFLVEAKLIKTGKSLLRSLKVWSKRIHDNPDNIPTDYLKELKMEKYGLKE